MLSKNDINTLIERTTRGDLNAYKDLYELNVREMLGVAEKITNSRIDAEDIVQDAFVIAFNKLSQLKNKSRFRYWLKRIVINSSLQLVKNKIKWIEISEISEDHNVDDSFYNGVSLEKINNSIKELPDGCRQIFVLYLLEGYKHKEIARELSITISTSKSQYRYAIHLLRNKIKKILAHES